MTGFTRKYFAETVFDMEKAPGNLVGVLWCDLSKANCFEAKNYTKTHQASSMVVEIRVATGETAKV